MLHFIIYTVLIFCLVACHTRGPASYSVKRQLQSLYEDEHLTPSRQDADVALKLLQGYPKTEQPASVQVALEFGLHIPPRKTSRPVVSSTSPQPKSHIHMSRPDDHQPQLKSVMLHIANELQASHYKLQIVKSTAKELVYKKNSSSISRTFTLNFLTEKQALSPTRFAAYELITPAMSTESDFEILNTVIDALNSSPVSIATAPYTSGLHIHIDFQQAYVAEFLFLAWLYNWIEMDDIPRHGAPYPGVINLHWYKRSQAYNEKIKSYFYYISQLIGQPDWRRPYYLLNQQERATIDEIIAGTQINLHQSKLEGLTSERASSLSLVSTKLHPQALKFSFAHHSLNKKRIQGHIRFAKTMVQKVRNQDQQLIDFLKAYQRQPELRFFNGEEDAVRSANQLAKLIDPQQVGVVSQAASQAQELYHDLRQVLTDEHYRVYGNPNKPSLYRVKLLQQAIKKGHAALAHLLHRMGDTKQLAQGKVPTLSAAEAVASDSIATVQFLLANKDTFKLSHIDLMLAAAQSSPEVLMYLVRSYSEATPFTKWLSKQSKFMSDVKALFSTANLNMLLRPRRSSVARSNKLLELWDRTGLLAQLNNKTITNEILMQLILAHGGDGRDIYSTTQPSQVLKVLIKNGFKLDRSQIKNYVNTTIEHATAYSRFEFLDILLASHGGHSAVMQGFLDANVEATKVQLELLIQKHNNMIAHLLVDHLPAANVEKWYLDLRQVALQSNNVYMMKLLLSPQFFKIEKKIEHHNLHKNLDELMFQALKDKKHDMLQAILQSLPRFMYEAEKEKNKILDDLLFNAVTYNPSAIGLILQEAPDVNPSAALEKLHNDHYLEAAKNMLHGQPRLESQVLWASKLSRISGAPKIKAMAKKFMKTNASLKERLRCMLLLSP